MPYIAPTPVPEPTNNHEPPLPKSDVACHTAISTPTSGIQDSSAEARLPARPRPIRKKSGDIVRPILRPPDRRRHSSAPPGYCPKNVRFDNFRDVDIRPFYCTEEPISISREKRDLVAEGPPKQATSHRRESSQLELVQINFELGSCYRQSQPVYLKHMQLSEAQTGLLGIVGVENTAFEKRVTCVFSFDDWRTVSRVDAKYQPGTLDKSAGSDVDFFAFTVDLADIVGLGSKTFRCCIRSVVGGREFWDNNQGANYELNFVRRVMQPPESTRFAQADVTARVARQLQCGDNLKKTTLSDADDNLDTEDFSSDDLEGDISG